MRQTDIYVGLNDSDTKEQRFGTDRYVSILKNVCRSYRTSFSVHTVDGGYFHDDGTYVEETTLVVTLMDADDALVDEIAKDLCAFFNQESVLISEREASVRYIREDL